MFPDNSDNLIYLEGTKLNFHNINEDFPKTIALPSRGRHFNLYLNECAVVVCENNSVIIVDCTTKKIIYSFFVRSFIRNLFFYNN